MKEYKYLGIIIHKKNCSFRPATDYLKNKATRALYALKSKINVYRLPIHLAFKLFDTLVKPILLYCSEVWEPFLGTDQKSTSWDETGIERTYSQYLKQILGVKGVGGG